MAKAQLVALDDLTSKFADFQNMSDMVNTLNITIEDINTRNKAAAGNDQIGQNYHSQVDQPTKDLTSMVGQVADVLGGTAIAGQDASKTLTAADEEAALQAGG